MCTKMNILGLILGVFLVVLAANCEESHHIDQRILDEQEGPDGSDNDFNITYSKLKSSLEDIASNTNSSSKLHQVVSYVIKSLTNENATISPADTVVSTTHFNVSLLLRTNTSDPLFINVGIKPNSSDTAANVVSEENRKLVAGDANVEESVVPEQNETSSKIETETKVDTEVKDLLDQDSYQVENHQHPFEPSEPLHIPDKIDKQTELIEDDVENTEDVLRRHRDENITESTQGTMAIVLVSVFVGMSVLCYAGLLLWRKYLEDRYGSRTLLVDAEEFNDPNDMRHFSI